MSAFLKNWSVMGLGGRCLSVWGLPPARFLFGMVKQFCRFGIWSNTQCMTPVNTLHTTRPPPPVTVSIHKFTHVHFSYLCTYDLCGPVHNVFDACRFITRASGKGLFPRNREFFEPCEMASSQPPVLFSQQSVHISFTPSCRGLLCFWWIFKINFREKTQNIRV